jgi:hypothetical protein
VMARSLTEIQALCENHRRLMLDRAATYDVIGIANGDLYAAAREELPRLAGVLKEMWPVLAERCPYFAEADPTWCDVNCSSHNDHGHSCYRVRKVLRSAGITP